jgi:hypothetical protein
MPAGSERATALHPQCAAKVGQGSLHAGDGEQRNLNQPRDRCDGADGLQRLDEGRSRDRRLDIEHGIEWNASK